MNKGDPEKEKMMTWNQQMGFISENSNDERIKFERFKKFQREDYANMYGSYKPFVQKRQLKPFEKLIIEKLGGREILEQYLDKNLVDDINQLQMLTNVP